MCGERPARVRWQRACYVPRPEPYARSALRPRPRSSSWPGPAAQAAGAADGRDAATRAGDASRRRPAARRGADRSPPVGGAAADVQRRRPARPRRRRRPPARCRRDRSAQWSSEPAGGVMMPAHVPPAPPRLAINLSPAAATRALAMLGLGVALSATVATTLAVIATSPDGLPTETPAAIVQFTNWLVSVPWLFVAVVLAASSRVERVVRPGAGPAWATLAFAAAACAAMQVVGRDLGVDVDAGDPRRPDCRVDAVAVAGLPAVPGRSVQDWCAPRSSSASSPACSAASDRSRCSAASPASPARPPSRPSTRC